MRKHSNICPDCGVWLDPGEICDCRDEAQEVVNIQEMDNDSIDSLFNSLLPSEQRRVLVVGLVSVLGCSLSTEGGLQNG